MSRQFVVDNSVVMAWCFEDETNTYTESVLGLLEDHQAVVPAIWPLEAGNVLLIAEWRKRISPAAGKRFLSLLTELPITVEQETSDRMLGEIIVLAREYQLSTYDASYLDLALRHGLALATQDHRLLNAARQLSIELLQ